MKIDAKLLNLVKNIDNHVNKFANNETGNTQLLTTIYDHMDSFKQVIDLSTPVEMGKKLGKYKNCHSDLLFIQFLQLLSRYFRLPEYRIDNGNKFGGYACTEIIR